MNHGWVRLRHSGLRLGRLLLVLALAGPGWAQTNPSPFEAWKSARETAKRAGLSKAADKYYSPAFLARIHWPEKGKSAEGWLRYPLFLIDDLHQWKEKRVDGHACLLLNGYTATGRAATVSLRLVPAGDRECWLIDRFGSLESESNHGFPEQALCPDELEGRPTTGQVPDDQNG